MTSTETQTLQVPLEACAFLAAVGGFVVLLFIFFLYLNKAFCFNKCSILPCDTNGPIKSQSKSKRLSSTFGYEDPNETSSDSDDEVLRRYQQSITVSRSQSHHAALGRTAAKLKCVTELVKRGGHSLSSAKHSATIAGSNKEESRDRKQTQEPVVKESAKFTIGDPEQENDIDDSVVIRSPSGASLDRTPIIPPGERRASDLKHPGFQAPDEDSSSQSQCYQNKAFTEMEAGLDPGMIPPHAGSEKDHQLSDQGAASVGFDDSNSNGDQDENLFDTGDLQDHEPIIISKCGNLSVSFHYQTATGRMSVTVHGARDIPSRDRGGAHHTQVRLLLLPTKKAKHKTKIKTGEAPSFEETFQFKVPIEELNNMGMRFRLYGCERMRRERMIGECVFAFVTVALDSPVDQWLTLEPRSNLSHGDSKTDITSLTRSDSGSSCQSMQHGGMPELLIGLSYNGMTGRLSVQVIKGSNFKNMAMTRAPDTYVKLTLMSPTGQEIARSKTSIRRGQPHPLFKETFMFQIPLFQLPDVTLMVSVFYNKSIKRKEMIGWFSLGFSNSSDEELSHWTDMRESKHEDEVCRWHVLLEP